MKKILNFLQPKVLKSDEATPDLNRELKRIIEGLLFATHVALSLNKIQQIIETQYPVTKAQLNKLMHALKEEYQTEKRGFRIDEIAEGFLLRTIEEVHPFVEQLHRERRTEKLSKAATEVLAIIAYKQPITRREIEEIRGVDCTSSVANLIERGLIEIIGQKEAVGRPNQYGITKKFLHHFGLKTLQDFV